MATSPFVRGQRSRPRTAFFLLFQEGRFFPLGDVNTLGILGPEALPWPLCPLPPGLICPQRLAWYRSSLSLVLVMRHASGRVSESEPSSEETRLRDCRGLRHGEEA